MVLSPLCLLSNEGQVFLQDPAGLRQLTIDLSQVMWGTASAGAWSWPSLSPDGRSVVAFEQDEQTGTTRIHVLATDQPTQTVLVELSDSLPLYVSWRPDGRALAALTQQGEEISLGVLRPDRLGELREVEVGGPLFFSWMGDRLLVRVGTGEDARMVLRDPLGPEEDVLLGTPGHFCCPLAIGDRLVLVERGPEGSELVVLDPQGERLHRSTAFQGLGALVPWGDRALFATAQDGPGTAYGPIQLLDPVTGELAPFCEETCLAFFPVADGRLLLARVDAERNCLTWRLREEDGEVRELCAFWPTREQLWQLQFFEQFALSHPPVSPDGRTLCFAGFLQGQRGTPPQVFRVDLDLGLPVPVLNGTFGCFAPGVSPG